MRRIGALFKDGRRRPSRPSPQGAARGRGACRHLRQTLSLEKILADEGGTWQALRFRSPPPCGQGCPGKIFAWRGLFLTSPRARGEVGVRARNARAPGEGAPDKATREAQFTA